MNNQKAKEIGPPSFRSTEASGPGRWFVGFNRLFENANLKLWVSFTPLARPSAWREGERKDKIERNSEKDQDEGGTAGTLEDMHVFWSR